MASKKNKKKVKKKKTAAKGGKGNEIKELRSMVEAMKKQLDKMQKNMKTQDKKIKNLEIENKRMKKNMLGGGLKQSDTPRANTPSPAPKNDEDDTKQIEEKIEPSKPETKPKPVVRRKKKTPNIKFTFDLQHQKISADGAVAKKPKTYGGTIRFGRFLNFKSNNKDKIASYKITFDTQSIGQISSSALGFATPSFNNWIGSNFGDNNSCLIKGNGQCLLTDNVFPCVDGKAYKHRQVLDVYKSGGLFKSGEDVTVLVDLKNFIGKVWNDTANKDGADNDKVFEIQLPEKYDVCVVAYLGGSAKKILRVKDQVFMFDDEEEG